MVRLPSRPSFGVRMPGVVEDLIFHDRWRSQLPPVFAPVTWSIGIKVGLAEIFDAAVRAWRDLEVQHEFKMGEAFARDDVAARSSLRPPVARTLSTPSLISQPLVGKFSALALRQPVVVLPSQSKRQPAACSSAVNVLSGGVRSVSFRFRQRTWVPSLSVLARYHAPAAQ
jgi:hypothetical protein